MSQKCILLLNYYFLISFKMIFRLISISKTFLDMEEFKRLRRIPIMLPQNYFYRAPMAAYTDEDYDYDTGK